MSYLKLYAPDAERIEDTRENRSQNPPTNSLNCHSTKTTSKSVLERARRIYKNRSCLHCHSVAVLPLELADGVRLSRHYSLAGTGTLVGFRCLNCLMEWQA